MPTFKLASGDITWKLVSEVGHQSFGWTTLGAKLPDYSHWRLGALFARGDWNLEVNYQDTNLSKQDCFVLTGDTSSGAVPEPGGSTVVTRIGRFEFRRFVQNSEGLRSDLCGRAVVGVLSFQFSPPKQ
jgi:hypothetical protein